MWCRKRIGRMVSNMFEMRPWRRFEKRWREFEAAHRGVWVPDEQLLADVFRSPNDVEASVALAIRRLIARDCGVQPEMIGPSETTQDLALVMGSAGAVGWLFGGP